MRFPLAPNCILCLLVLCSCLSMAQNTISQQVRDSTEFYGKIIMNPSHDSELAAAIQYYERASKRDLKNNDTLSAIISLRYISIGQAEMGAIHESEATATQALELADNLPLDTEVIRAKRGLFHDLGRVYRLLESPANSIRYYTKSIELAESTFDSVIVINNLGNVLTDMGNYSLALKEFEAAYKTSPTLDSLTQFRILDNMGFVQSKLLHPDALDNMMRAMAGRERADDLTGLYSSYRHLALHFHSRNQPDQAMEYAKKAYLKAKEIKSPSYLKNALTNLLKIREDSLGQRFIALNDSIEKAKLARQNKYAAMQYNIAKERKKTEANRLLQEKEKRSRQAFQFIGLLLVIILVGYYFLEKELSKKRTLQQVYQTEKRISQKIHDEVANDVYHLMNKIQLNAANDEILLDDLDRIYKKTRDISKENSELLIQEDFGNQLSGLIQSYQYEDTVITIQNISKINWKSIPDVKKTSLYRVLQELMTNMKKHSKCTHVLISFEQNKSKVQIKYRDNGVGSLLNNRNGLLNVENRIKAVNGSIIFDTEPQNGFKAQIII